VDYAEVVCLVPLVDLSLRPPSFALLQKAYAALPMRAALVVVLA
jgi:hypothetical protein